MRILVLASAIVLAGSMRGGPVATAQAPAAMTITDLGTLGTNSFATGINASGQVVGMSNLSSGARRAFLWTATGGMVNLGTLGGSESEATGINRVGTIIGGGWTTLGEWHGWRRPAGGSLVDISAADGCCTHLHGINDAGWIAGSDFLGPAPVHQLRAVIWKGPGLVQVIGEAWANAVNDRGEVVGSAAGKGVHQSDQRACRGRDADRGGGAAAARRGERRAGPALSGDAGRDRTTDPAWR